ncbi:ABC transporter permease [Agromyces larvae]|uniref:ABC transporter permease n=1 Tax=Agromyces larvae TaxID=2929802 RepID=A0ABY4C1R6_9MICO|nr:ABC transporter permease [Agromyces larvae]UOE44387.1 ABC transporter permease [Agromyces larvae]
MTESIALTSERSTHPARRARRRRTLRMWAGKVLQGVLTLLLVSVLIFFATQLMPGDVAKVILGVNATPERIATVRQQLGLDQPIWQQYLSWLGGILHGDWGVSLTNGVPVADTLSIRLRNSVALGAMALVIMLPISLVVGVVAAQRKDRVFDSIFMGSSMTVNAVPEFVLGTVLIALFGTTVFHLFPPVALIPPADMPWWHPMEMVLPVTTLVIGGVAYLSRLVRVSFIDVMNSEYIQTARLKGLSTRRILYRHALPNALAPIIPAASLVAAFLIGGTVVVEYLFSYPGIGLTLVEAVNNRDLPLIQAVVLIIASAYFVFNFIADLLSDAGSASRKG